MNIPNGQVLAFDRRSKRIVQTDRASLGSLLVAIYNSKDISPDIIEKVEDLSNHKYFVTIESVQESREDYGATECVVQINKNLDTLLYRELSGFIQGYDQISGIDISDNSFEGDLFSYELVGGIGNPSRYFRRLQQIHNSLDFDFIPWKSTIYDIYRLPYMEQLLKSYFVKSSGSIVLDTYLPKADLLFYISFTLRALISSLPMLEQPAIRYKNVRYPITASTARLIKNMDTRLPLELYDHKEFVFRYNGSGNFELSPVASNLLAKSSVRINFRPLIERLWEG